MAQTREERRAVDNEYYRRRYPRIREQKLAVAAIYYQHNREKMLAQQRAYRRANWLARKIAKQWHLPIAEARRLVIVGRLPP